MSAVDRAGAAELPADVMSLFRLNGQVAVVTGAGAGIGRAAAHALAQAGASVAVTDMDGAAAAAVVAEIRSAGGRAEPFPLDVADAEQICAGFNAIITRQGRIDVLVNNAGIGAREPSETMSLEVWNRVVAINLTGTFLCCQQAGRRMLAQGGGRIVNIASIMGMVGGGLYPNLAYHSTKGAVVNLTRALAVEWADRGVRVNAIAPTFVRTRLTEKLLGDTAIEEEIRRLTPMGRLAQPDEIAAAVLYLASEASAMVTGHVLAVDGGWLAR